MGPFGRGPVAPACATVALLAGCGAGWQLGSSQSQPKAPAPQTLALIDRGGGAHADPGRSWMAKNRKKNDLLYFAIHGTNAKAIGATALGGSSDVLSFYIQQPYVVGADAANDDVELWDYPAGGSPVKVITGQSAYATGVVVSVGKKR